MTRVLFIDPHDEERQSWARRLTMHSSDYVVLEAADGQSGLKLIKSEPVDCVVLELNLPDRNGLSLLLDLVDRVYNPQIAVIVLTDFPLESIFPRAIENGAQSCLRKDQISVEDLDVAIRKAIAVVGLQENRPA